MRRAAAAIVLLLLLAGTAFPRDRVKLKGGRTLEGVVESKDENVVVLRTKSGVLRIPRKRVEAIEELKDEPKPEAKADEGTGGDPAPGNGKPAAKKPGPGVETPKDAGSRAVSPPKKADGEEPDEAWKAKVLGDFGHKLAKNRAAAAQAIVEAWPESAATLDLALASRNKVVRLEAVRLLGRTELGETQARIRKCLEDSHPPVRQMAARAVRLRGFAMEKELIALVRGDPEARVALEAIRALEDVGTWRCHRALYRRWDFETDEELKRRYRRNLKRFLKVNHGEDKEAWLAAIQEAEDKARTESK